MLASLIWETHKLIKEQNKRQTVGKRETNVLQMGRRPRHGWGAELCTRQLHARNAAVFHLIQMCTKKEQGTEPLHILALGTEPREAGPFILLEFETGFP